MREILFRGKRIENGEWIYGHYFKYDETHNVVPDHYSSKPSGWHRVVPETVGQFTGLTDKNGVKIFEGDILLYLGAKGSVYYDADLAMFMCRFKTNRSIWSFDSMDDLIEVIGNIHEDNVGNEN